MNEFKIKCIIHIFCNWISVKANDLVENTEQNLFAIFSSLFCESCSFWIYFQTNSFFFCYDEWMSISMPRQHITFQSMNVHGTIIVAQFIWAFYHYFEVRTRFLFNLISLIFASLSSKTIIFHLCCHFYVLHRQQHWASNI